MKTPYLYMMVGLPGSGKSTYIEGLKEDHDDVGIDYVILSTDAYIEEKAAQEGKTYSEVFQKYIGEAERKLESDIQMALFYGSDIIWDQTNMSAKSRAKKLAKIPKEYHKVAVVFDISPEELQRRLDKRAAETGKVIPRHIIENMKKTYEEPSEAEGFNRVIFVRA